MFFHKILFNQTENKRIKGTKLIEEYIIKGNSENEIIITNFMTIYIMNSHLNSAFNPLIIVNENI